VKRFREKFDGCWSCEWTLGDAHHYQLCGLLSLTWSAITRFVLVESKISSLFITTDKLVH